MAAEEPGDHARAFYRLSVPKKVVVMMGGPLMNLVIAVVLLTGLVTLYGAPTAQPGAVVAAVSECVVPASQATTALENARLYEETLRANHELERRVADDEPLKATGTDNDAVNPGERAANAQQLRRRTVPSHALPREL